METVGTQVNGLPDFLTLAARAWIPANGFRGFILRPVMRGCCGIRDRNAVLSGQGAGNRAPGAYRQAFTTAPFVRRLLCCAIQTGCCLRVRYRLPGGADQFMHIWRSGPRGRRNKLS